MDESFNLFTPTTWGELKSILGDLFGCENLLENLRKIAEDPAHISTLVEQLRQRPLEEVKPTDSTDSKALPKTGDSLAQKLNAKNGKPMKIVQKLLAEYDLSKPHYFKINKKRANVIFFRRVEPTPESARCLLIMATSADVLSTFGACRFGNVQRNPENPLELRIENPRPSRGENGPASKKKVLEKSEIIMQGNPDEKKKWKTFVEQIWGQTEAGQGWSTPFHMTSNLLYFSSKDEMLVSLILGGFFWSVRGVRETLNTSFEVDDVRN